MEEIMPLLGLVLLCVFLIFGRRSLRGRRTASEEDISEDKTDLSPIPGLSFSGIVRKSLKLYKDNFFKLIAMSSLVSLPMMFLFTTLESESH